MSARWHFRHLLTGEGWQRDVLMEADAAGRVARLGTTTEPDDDVTRFDLAVPGMANVHSHAHQRLLAGLTGRPGSGPDSFWTWRTRMYATVALLDPESYYDLAGWLFAELLEGGYTRLGEFHYLHHPPGGGRYARPAAMAEALVAAAAETGLNLTLLPVLYRHGDFGRKPPVTAQAPFINDGDEYVRLVAATDEAAGGHAGVDVGLAPHSLRAVDIDEVAELAAAWPDRVKHIHIAEQTAEVEACRAAHDCDPLELLAERVDLDGRWCLIHATHASEWQLAAAAATGARVGLCPTTEADLGDGLFPAVEYLAAGGGFGIGSDSNLCTDAATELRLLEWSQRYRLRRRNLLADDAGIGTFLWRHAADQGGRALGRDDVPLAPGQWADFVVLDPRHPMLAGLSPASAVDVLLTAGGAGLIDRVYTRGQERVSGGRHPARAALEPAWRNLRRRLVAADR